MVGKLWYVCGELKDFLERSLLSSCLKLLVVVEENNCKEEFPDRNKEAVGLSSLLLARSANSKSVVTQRVIKGGFAVDHVIFIRLPVNLGLRVCERE